MLKYYWISINIYIYIYVYIYICIYIYIYVYIYIYIYMYLYIINKNKKNILTIYISIRFYIDCEISEEKKRIQWKFKFCDFH